MTVLIPFLVPLWLGLALVGAAGAFHRDSGRWARLLAITLALPLGIGLSSMMGTLWLTVLRPWIPVAGLVLIEVILAVTLSACWWYRRLNVEPWPHRFCVNSGSGLLVVGVGALALAVAAWRAGRTWLVSSFRAPLGDWDAVAIWNLKARFLFCREGWQNAFSPEIPWSHPDYPLLLPGFYARSWSILGEPTWIVPAAAGLVFMVVTVALVTLAVYRQRGAALALLGGTLTSSVAYLSLNFSQYPDLPLACFFLIANVLLIESERQPRALGLVFLAGLAAGALVWTKNEGWAMLVAIVISEAVTRWRRDLPAPLFARRAGVFALGLLPLTATTVLFKSTLAPANDIVAGAMWSGLLDPDRWATVLGALASSFFTYGVLPLPLPALLLFCALVLGVQPDATMRPALASLAARLLLTLAAYGFVFLITPVALDLHLTWALERLLTQLAPSVILLTLVATRRGHT